MDERLIVTEKILIEEESNLVLANRGYVVFPFLDKADIDLLSQYYFKIQKETPDFFYSSTHSKNHSFRKEASEFIKQIIARKLPVFFKNYKLLGGAFVVKPPHGKGLLPPHQDWNIVDESKHRSYNLWIPLIDVNIDNGAVFVLDGSHNKVPTYRGPGIPSLFKDIEKQVWESLKPLPMKAGEALFYDHALLHASPVNQTDQIRLGVVCGIIPKDVNMQLYFKEGDGISSYQANEDFFLEKNPMEGPVGLVLIENISNKVSSLTKEQYNSIFLTNSQPINMQWFKKMLGIK